MIGFGASRGGRLLVLVALASATIGMLVVSLRGNYLFGYQLGQTEEKRQLFAWANVAADIWKAFGLIAISALWRVRRYLAASGAVVVWLLCLLSGLNSAIGIYVQDRTATTSERDARRLTYAEVVKELAVIEARITRVATTRSVTEIEAMIAGALGQPVVVSERRRGTVGGVSENCQKPDVRTADLCVDVLRLRAELASALEGQALEGRAEQLRARMRTLRDHGAASAPDPVSEFYAWMTRGVLDVRDIGFGFPLFFALLIEVVSAFGPIGIAAYADATFARSKVIEGHVRLVPAVSGSDRPWPATERKLLTDDSSVAAWMAERARPTTRARALMIDELFEDYCQWCAENNAETGDISKFRDRLNELLELPVLAGRIKRLSDRYYGVELVTQLLA